MASSGIPSARKKFVRASEHVDALRAAVESYRNKFPPTFDVQSVGNQSGMPEVSVTVTVASAEPIPDAWSLMTGDVVTNLRAALDHAIYPHVRSRHPKLADPNIQFPIMDDETKFNRAKFVKDAHFTQPVLAEVRNAQPFNHKNRPEGTAWHPFAVLRELVNFDKHRELLIVQSLPEQWTFDLDARLQVVELNVYRETAMTTGALICDARLQPKTDTVLGEEIPLPSELGHVEKIDIPNAGRGHLLATLERFRDDVLMELDALEQAGC
jgi:hypothetical protein